MVRRHVPCPHCPSSDGYCEYVDHGHCFSCGAHDYFNDKPDVKYTYEFLPWRGVSANTFKFYNCLTKIDAEGKPISIGFKYPGEDSFKVRKLDEKDFYSKNYKAGLFGKDLFESSGYKYVTITEGELDALSLFQTLGSGPVVSVHSSGSALSDCTVDRDWLNGFERVYFAFDNDSAGREALRLCAKLFASHKVYHVKFETRKDANEYVENGEEDLLKKIWWNSKEYLPDNIKSSLSDFKDMLVGENRWGVPYPFPTLTKMTYGIRTGESVLFTALEGVGKTEIMHTILHKLLKETDDAIGAIFLEEPGRRLLQAIAGIELGRPVHLPDSGVADGEIYSAVEKVVLRDDRLYVYTHFGSDDGDILLDTIRYLATARKCRYIILDHISICVSGLSETDERRYLDRFITRLEMLIQELDVAVIFVSHVNDEGQTRGSRFISKIAHIRVDAFRDVLSSNDETKRTTKLVVSKNRYAWKTGDAGSILFDPITGTLSEVQAANDNFPQATENVA